MNVCKFIKKFNKLKKSSSDSIDNILSFDDFRKYMHVIRATEIDLKSILSAVNSSNKKTCKKVKFNYAKKIRTAETVLNGKIIFCVSKLNLL